MKIGSKPYNPFKPAQSSSLWQNSASSRSRFSNSLILLNRTREQAEGIDFCHGLLGRELTVEIAAANTATLPLSCTARAGWGHLPYD